MARGINSGPWVVSYESKPNQTSVTTTETPKPLVSISDVYANIPV